MSQRCLIVTDAPASRPGTPAWRRLQMFVDIYRETGFDPHLLLLHDGKTDAPDQAAVRRVRGHADHTAIATSEAAGGVVEALDARWQFRVFHIAAPSAPHWIGARRRGLRLADGVAGLSQKGRLAERAKHTDMFLTTGSDEDEAAETAGRPPLRATYLRRATRSPGRRISADRVLAGCWVEDADPAVFAVQALFDALRHRGGGAPPAFLIAGPGAPRVTVPQMPDPVLRLDPDITERVFYRGLDVALFPARRGDRVVRYDALAALELGATPLASTAALEGVVDTWRVPHFDDLDRFAEYLFERGRDLRDGGLLAELRARADWTWSRLQGEAANQRAALATAIRAHLKGDGL